MENKKENGCRICGKTIDVVYCADCLSILEFEIPPPSWARHAADSAQRDSIAALVLGSSGNEIGKFPPKFFVCFFFALTNVDFLF